MNQTREINISNTSKTKRTKSMKRTPSSLSINSSISGIISNASIVRQMSFKRHKTAPESADSITPNKESNSIQSGYLTSLDVHDYNGDVVEGESIHPTKSNESQNDLGGVICLNASSDFNIDLTRKNFTPTSKPPNAPPGISPVVNSRESYTSLASLVPSEKSSNVTVNSISYSVSNFVKGIPKALRSDLSLHSTSAISSSANESPINEFFTIHDAEHAYLNKQKVKLSEIKPNPTKRWLKIFKAKTSHIDNYHSERTCEKSLPSFPGQLLFKKPPKITQNMKLQNRRSWKSLIKSDPNIIPQKINLPIHSNDCKIHTEASQNERLKKHLFGDFSVPPADNSKEKYDETKIFSPNPELKNSYNSPNYPEYLSGFSSLCIDVPVQPKTTG